MIFHSYYSMGLAVKVSSCLSGQGSSTLLVERVGVVGSWVRALVEAHLQVFKGTDAQNSSQLQQPSSVCKHAVFLERARVDRAQRPGISGWLCVNMFMNQWRSSLLSHDTHTHTGRRLGRVVCFLTRKPSSVTLTDRDNDATCPVYICLCC